MDEQPQSIWKKNITGRMALIIWLAVAMVALILGTFIASLADYIYPMSNWAAAVAIFAGLCFTGVGLVIYVVWPLSRWLFWKHWRRTLFGLACFATLIALGYAEEDWRGKHDWKKFQREWEARGEKFDFASIIPPPVPDDQNFAMSPVVASSYAQTLTRDGKKIPYEERDTNIVDRLSFDLGDADIKTNGYGSWIKGTTSNLKVWQDNYRALAAKTNLFAVPPQPQSPAADVLLALSKYDAAVEELRSAGERPQCRFPLNYDAENCATILLPHLATMKRATQLLKLRALAELQNGQSEKALADVHLTLRLTEAMRTEPFLISHLVRIAMTEIILQPIYEGLANHQWTDNQLVTLDAELAKLDFLADYQLAMRGERVFSLSIIDYVSKKPRYKKYQEMTEMMGDNNNNPTTSEILQKTARGVGFWLMPAGWFEQNKLVIAKGQQDWMDGIIFPEKHLASPSKYNEIGLAKDHLFQNASRPWNFLSKELMPALGAMAKKSSREQISVDLARTAIALERCRLAHGEFPEALDVLAPQFIAKVPHDVISGQPLRYRRTADGQFVLYSVGWNEKDDGGVTIIHKGGTQPRFEEGDWVWRYPIK